MRRWVNAHKGWTIAVTIAVLALAGTWLSRRDGAASSTSSPAVVDVAVSTTPARPPSSEVASSSLPPQSASDRLDVPVDPSGSRHLRDESGVRQVAIDYLSTVKQRVLYMAPTDVPALLEQWAAPGVAGGELTDTATRFGQLRDALSEAGGQVWWAVSPLAVKVEAFAADRARVAVWTATVMASGAAPGVDATVAAPQVAYMTGTVELLWDDTSGWSVWSITETPGPVPMAAVDQAPVGPAEFLTALSGFSLIKEHR